jgi:hypothetical protein
MKRILISVITEGDSCVAPFCSSLVESVRLGLANDVEFFPVFFESRGNWAMAFNHSLTITWAEKLDGMVCISPQVSWAPSDLLSLISTDKEVVCLPVHTGEGFDMDMGEISRLKEEEETGEIQVYNSSLEFIYLGANAINKMCETHHSVDYRGNSVKLVIQSGDIYDSYYPSSEILSYRLREQGFETWVSSRHTAYRRETVYPSGTFEDVLKSVRSNE